MADERPPSSGVPGDGPPPSSERVARIRQTAATRERKPTRSLKEVVRELRVSHELTQVDLADLTGIPQFQISKMEAPPDRAHSRPVHAEDIVRIEDALGIPRGTVYRAAGLSELGVTVPEAIASDPKLDPVDKDLLLVQYQMMAGRRQAAQEPRRKRKTARLESGATLESLSDGEVGTSTSDRSTPPSGDRPASGGG
jgi:transcriptional regulator with XRE-family HTH domain